MSDFLTRIVSLTRGETTAVKPRLPGQFAPVPDIRPERPPDEAAMARKRDLKSDLTKRPPAPGPDPAARGAQASAYKSESATLRADDMNTFSDALQTSRGSAEIEDNVTPNLAGTPPAPEIDAMPADHETRVDTEWADSYFENTGSTEIPLNPVLPGNEVHSETVTQNSRTTQTPAYPRSPELLVQPQPAGRNNTGLPDLPAVSDTPQRARIEPGVHINIGRIEVRASTSTPRPQPQNPRPRPQSSLSLQDYLARGRKGGNRS